MFNCFNYSMIFARWHAKFNLKSFPKWRSCSALVLSILMLVTDVVDVDVVVIGFDHGVGGVDPGVVSVEFGVFVIQRGVVCADHGVVGFNLVVFSVLNMTLVKEITTIIQFTDSRKSKRRIIILLLLLL